MRNPENEGPQPLEQRLESAIVCSETSGERRFTFEIDSTSLRSAVETLKQKFPTLRFITISATDIGLDIEYLYHFDIDGKIISLRTFRPKEENVFESIIDIVPASGFIEREIVDLFGVKISNRPKEKSLLLTEDWPPEKHPLRRPLEGELPPKMRPVIEALITTSSVASISKFMFQRREKVGLPRTPPLALQDEQTLQEFQKVIRDTELDKKTGFDWKKKKLRY